MWATIIIIMILFILLVGFGGLKASKNPFEQAEEDRIQEEYLKQWVEEHKQKGKKK